MTDQATAQDNPAARPGRAKLFVPDLARRARLKRKTISVYHERAKSNRRLGVRLPGDLPEPDGHDPPPPGTGGLPRPYWWDDNPALVTWLARPRRPGRPRAVRRPDPAP